MNNGAKRNVRLVFADDGSFHSVTVTVPAERIGDYDRLVDFLREDPDVTQQLYVDMKRLVSAALIDEDQLADPSTATD